MTRATPLLTFVLGLGLVGCAEEQPNDDLFGSDPSSTGGTSAGSAGAGGMSVAAGGTGVGLKDGGSAGSSGVGGGAGFGSGGSPAMGGSGGAPSPGAGSCVGACGGPTPDESCYCDEICESYGDCCADFVSACPGEASTPQPTGCSAQSCNSDQPVTDAKGPCYCDAACSQYGDCCANKEQICGP